MASNQKDHWSTEAYQHSASFVPKLAVKVMSLLDPKPDDVILDIGCGDGILDVQLAEVLSKGKGRVHGIDSSPAMIRAAATAAEKNGASSTCTFEAFDATELVNKPELQKGQFTKAFSNAAMHWILRPEEKRQAFFRGVHGALAPGGRFAFEQGGFGNVHEMLCGILGPVSRRIGLEAAVAVSPWFFPDEKWMRAALEDGGRFEVERIETEHRPTPADAGGVDGWVRLMGKQFFEAVPKGEREACIREAVEVLQAVCKNPDGGYTIGYVRLRALARRL